MRRILLPIPILFLCSCAAAVSQRSGPLGAADFVVRGVEANLDSARVVAMLGAPDSVSIEPNPYNPASHLTALIYPGLRVQMADGKVLGEVLDGGSVATARGLKVGDADTRVLQLYGEPTERIGDTWQYADLQDPTGHHVFRVTVTGGRVAQIQIGWVFD